MKTFSNIWFSLLLTIAFVALNPLQPTAHAQQSTTAPATKDSTIWSGNDGGNTDPQLSNGAGSRIIVGINGRMGGNKIMRSPIAFDLSGIPSGSTITSVTLQMNVDMAAAGSDVPTPLMPLDISLHRLTSDWGESTSDAINGPGASLKGPGGIAAAQGDATWGANVLGTSTWSTAGGDFVSQASATNSIGLTSSSEGAFSWSGSGLVTDVQNWIDGTNPNYGWMIIADEQYHTCCYVVLFDSREAATSANQPQLLIEFTPPSDNEDPVAVCADATVKLNTDNDNAPVPGTLIDGGSTDNVAIASLTTNPSMVASGDLNTTVTVTLTVTDTGGNTDTCDASVFVTSVLDVNSDGIISPADAVYVANRVGMADEDADIDGVGDVTLSDLQAVLDALGDVVGE